MSIRKEWQNLSNQEWRYEEYSQIARILARTKTKEEIIKEIERINKELEKATKSHLKAIKQSTSMQSNSQRRAQASNLVAGLGERKMALENALEIHKYYPEKCKRNAQEE